MSKQVIEREELKNCPFCGGEELQHGYEKHSFYWVECTDCEVAIGRDTGYQAIKAWNTRAGDKG